MKRFAVVVLALPLVGSVAACDVEEPIEDELEFQDLDDEDAEVFHIVADVVEPDDSDDAAAPADDAPAQVNAAPDVSFANFYEPVGTLDRADCSRIAGWAKDGDTTSPTWVSIRTAPWPSGSHVTTVYANKHRADLPFPDKNHGFNIATPASLKNGVNYWIYAHGINVDTNGDWDVNANSPLLSGSGKKICCGVGCFEPPGGDGGPPPE